MPTHLRMKCGFKFMDDTPKNVAVINPCFRVQTDPFGSVDAQALVDDLANKLAFLPKATGPFYVSCYEIGKPKPNYPLATAQKNWTQPIVLPTVVPEAAVCLSFYADQNRPRHRGRLYWPAWLLGASTSDMARSIPASLRTMVETQVGYFASLGGVNVDWGVWSSVDQAFHRATNYFISDAWAIQRRRGIKETARTSGTTSG